MCLDVFPRFRSDGREAYWVLFTIMMKVCEREALSLQQYTSDLGFETMPQWSRKLFQYQPGVDKHSHVRG